MGRHVSAPAVDRRRMRLHAARWACATAILAAAPQAAGAQDRPDISLQQAKDEIRKSKPKTLDLIVKLLKMDKEAANETYDQFLTTLSSTGIPTRVGMDILVKSVQAQGRHVGRKVAFEEIADDRLATEVAKELGYKIP